MFENFKGFNQFQTSTVNHREFGYLRHFIELWISIESIGFQLFTKGFLFLKPASGLSSGLLSVWHHVIWWSVNDRNQCTEFYKLIQSHQWCVFRLFNELWRNPINNVHTESKIPNKLERKKKKKHGNIFMCTIWYIFALIHKFTFSLNNITVYIFFRFSLLSTRCSLAWISHLCTFRFFHLSFSLTLSSELFSSSGEKSFFLFPFSSSSSLKRNF